MVQLSQLKEQIFIMPYLRYCTWWYLVGSAHLTVSMGWGTHLSYVSLSHFKAALLQPVMSDLRGVH